MIIADDYYQGNDEDDADVCGSCGERLDDCRDLQERNEER